MTIRALAAAVTLAVAATPPARAGTYAIDPTHTFVTFEVDHFGTSTQRGRFDRKTGSVEFDRAARTGKVEITIDMASINTGVAAFNEQLRGRDFFDVAQFPTAVFVAPRIAIAGDKVTEVSGTLTMRGRTLPVTLKATRFNCYENPLLKREVCGGDFETTVRRSLWGLDGGLARDLADDVRLLVQVEAIEQ